MPCTVVFARGCLALSAVSDTSRCGNVLKAFTDRDSPLEKVLRDVVDQEILKKEEAGA